MSKQNEAAPRPGLVPVFRPGDEVFTGNSKLTWVVDHVGGPPDYLIRLARYNFCDGSVIHTIAMPDRLQFAGRGSSGGREPERVSTLADIYSLPPGTILRLRDGSAGVVYRENYWTGRYFELRTTHGEQLPFFAAPGSKTEDALAARLPALVVWRPR